MTIMCTGIKDRVALDIIRYSNCWEDADVVCKALSPEPGSRILSIASGGDNSIALAAEGAEVVAVDLSFPQLACTELKSAAIRSLEYDEVLAFLGVCPSASRLKTYALIRGELSDEARAYWDANRIVIARGLVHGGKLEEYFRTFRTRVLPLIHTEATVGKMFEEKSERERVAFYRGTWDNMRWRFLFRLFFGRFVMGRHGRDPEFFRYVEGSVGDRILARTQRALTELPTHANPYLQFLFTGTYGATLPRYLRRENFDAVREGVARLTLYQGSVEDAARAHGADGFDGYNLSDIFEYLDLDACRGIFGTLLSVANRGARLAYWNLLAPRSFADDFVGRVRPLAEFSERLHKQSLTWFYGAFVTEEVR